MVGNKARGGRALGIAVEIVVLVLLLANLYIFALATPADEHPLVAIGELSPKPDHLEVNGRKLARTSDEVLHTVYSRSDGSYSQIYHASSSDNGRTWREEALTSESYN